MSFLSRLFGRGGKTQAQEADVGFGEGHEVPGVPQEMAAELTAKMNAPSENPDVNIWDMDAEDDAASATPTPAANRRRRNATRIIGFDTSDGDLVDLFDDASEDTSNKVLFPVGWLLLIEGEGKGNHFPVAAGLNQIGRGDDNAIRLDFGDDAISRTNHATVVYDEAEGSFIVGHGGKSNIVRKNGKAVVSDATLKDGDKIQISDTVLQLKVLVGKSFQWAIDEEEEGEDAEEQANVASA